MTTFNITVGEQDFGERLDKLITVHLNTLSRVKVQQLIKEGLVMVDGKVAKAAYRLEGGESITAEIADDLISPLDTAYAFPRANPIPLDVLYEDADLIAINKPAGMIVHPIGGTQMDTLVNAVLARWPEIAKVGDPARPGIVHRLDKDTSGVILIAKTSAARKSLLAQFKAREVKKRYLTLVEGIPATPTGEINAPIGRNPAQRMKMTILRNGRQSLTRYRVLQVYEYRGSQYTQIEVLPQTGRTHQIRVHMTFIGHPVVGDTVYGRRKQRLKAPRQFLHAEAISFQSPRTGETLTIHAPLPADLQVILNQLTLA